MLPREFAPSIYVLCLHSRTEIMIKISPEFPDGVCQNLRHGLDGGARGPTAQPHRGLAVLGHTREHTCRTCATTVDAKSSELDDEGSHLPWFARALVCRAASLQASRAHTCRR